MNDTSHPSTASLPPRNRPAARNLLNTAIGNRELCAWQPVRGVCCVQTRSPFHARRLAQRRDGHLVAVGVAGGYLRTYEFHHPLSWAESLIRRYLHSPAPTNRRLNRLVAPQAAPESQDQGDDLTNQPQGK